jgi:polyhydroxybutyrate depolymerase
MRACAAWACWASLLALLLAGDSALADSMASGGLTRQYIVFRPPGVTGPRPAVLLLHGGLGTGAQMERYTDFDRVAAAASVVAVYPQGIDRQWNDHRSSETQSDVDDERFLLDLIDRLAQAGIVERNRVYIAGISNGALMALDMACNHADRIAGIAVIAGSLPQGYRCAPVRPLPVIFFHGTSDQYIPFVGGRIAGQFAAERGSVVSAQESIDFFVKNAACRTRTAEPLPDPVPADGTHATIYRYGSCEPGGAVESVVIEGGGHSWPGARQGVMLDYLLGTASRATDASAELWRFFARTAEAR